MAITNNDVKTNTIKSVGGSSTHIVLEFPDIGFIYMGSVVSLSYNVYRDKAPVFNCGNTTISGFAIGKKYVAGSMVNLMFSKDEISDFISKYNLQKQLENTDISDFAKKQNSDQSLKEIHTFMKDDLTSFNIHCIFTSEYHDEATRIIIYGANFINNGQVMSVDDIITESTISFVAKDLREQHHLSEDITTLRDKTHILTGSQLIAQKEGTSLENPIVRDINFDSQRVSRDNPFVS